MGCEVGTLKVLATGLDIQKDYRNLGLCSKQLAQFERFFYSQNLNQDCCLELEEFFSTVGLRRTPLLYGVFDPFKLIYGVRKQVSFSEVRLLRQCTYLSVIIIL